MAQLIGTGHSSPSGKPWDVVILSMTIPGRDRDG